GAQRKGMVINMKITFIIGSMSSGGAERVISVLSNELSHRGYEVSIIMFRESEEESYYLNESIDQIILTNKNISRGKRLLLLPILLLKEMKRQNANVYVSFCIFENVLSCFCNLALRKNLIISERNAPKHEKMSVVFKVMRKILYPTAKGIVFQTNEAMSSCSKQLQRKGIVIANPIKEGLPTKENYGLNYTIAAVGRLCEQKNYPMLFTAFRKFVDKHPEYTLLVFGHGELENELKELTRKMKLEHNIVFKGFCSNVHQQLVNTDVYVLSSDYEGMPNSLMEAMAIGLPVISTDCPSGGPRELVANEVDGFLIQTGNDSQLFSKLDMLIDDEELRKKVGNNARKVRNLYSKEEIVASWEKYILRIQGGE
ncbi:MAG: glycosyltransferase, partial [Agathobacter sp.]|nr:glycosyltransferase [Agathobacter sp.]